MGLSHIGMDSEFGIGMKITSHASLFFSHLFWECGSHFYSTSYIEWGWDLEILFPHRKKVLSVTWMAMGKTARGGNTYKASCMSDTDTLVD